MVTNNVKISLSFSKTALLTLFNSFINNNLKICSTMAETLQSLQSFVMFVTGLNYNVILEVFIYVR